jgi:hypothetical protein
VTFPRHRGSIAATPLDCRPQQRFLSVPSRLADATHAITSACFPVAAPNYYERAREYIPKINDIGIMLL